MKENLKEYRDNIKVHLVRISTDVEHIKEKVTDNNQHLEKINGRLRDAENSISAIKAIGATLTVIVSVILTWLGIER